jgi:hypothetical protein
VFLKLLAIFDNPPAAENNLDAKILHQDVHFSAPIPGSG